MLRLLMILLLRLLLLLLVLLGLRFHLLQGTVCDQIVKERSNPNYVHNGLRGRGLSKIVAEWTDELTFIDKETGGIKVKIRKYLKDPKIEQDMKQVMDKPSHLVLN